MRRSPAIFSVYMLSDHATTSSNVDPGPRGCKSGCKREPFFDHGQAVTSPTWGPPPPYKQAPIFITLIVGYVLTCMKKKTISSTHQIKR